jgi:hypothetical protein
MCTPATEDRDTSLLDAASAVRSLSDARRKFGQTCIGAGSVESWKLTCETGCYLTLALRATPASTGSQPDERGVAPPTSAPAMLASQRSARIPGKKQYAPPRVDTKERMPLTRVRSGSP